MTTRIKTIHNYDLINQSKPKQGRFNGFLRDITHIEKAIKEQIEKENHRRLRKLRFNPHSVNIPHLSLIESVIKSSQYTDWDYNGDDEISIEKININRTARNIFRALLKAGYIKL